MQQLQPDQASFLLHTVLLPALTNEHSITRKVVSAIPLDKGDYRPDSVSRGSLELAWHIISTEMRFMEAVSAGQFDLSPKPLPESIKNSADLASWYSENFNSRLQKVTAVPEEQLAKVLDFRGIYQLSAVLYLNFLLNHTIHHRGQLSTYLRPMGAKVPAIYGESYDSAEARKASQQTA